jgi:sugar lactone lactonase YvrE
MRKSRTTLGAALVAIVVVAGSAVYSQTPVNSLPNPYKSIADWAKLGRPWGSTAGVGIDRDGSSVWVAERCGAFAPPSAMKPGQPFACDGSNLDPILKFDASGKLVKSFGAGLFVLPHGLSVDPDGNIWVTDGVGKDGKGHQAIKFSPDGKELMRLGKAGVAPNGDIFVADGHGGNTNARIVKFDKSGKFIKAWGQKGSGPGDLDIPHALAMDSRGRLFVADRNNNRIQIYDQDGKLLDSWSQFSRPSGIAIDKKDQIYVVDSESGSVAKAHGDWKRGLRVGSAVDGAVKYFIPDPDEHATTTSAAEGVAVDAQGNVYGAEVGPKRLMRYVTN